MDWYMALVWDEAPDLLIVASWEYASPEFTLKLLVCYDNIVILELFLSHKYRHFEVSSVDKLLCSVLKNFSFVFWSFLTR